MDKETNIEILITAKIRDCGEEDEELLFDEVKEEIAKSICELAGNEVTKKGLWFYLKDVDHEVRFGHEGRFEFEESIEPICDRCSKRDNPKCVGISKTFYKGVIVDCTGFKESRGI